MFALTQTSTRQLEIIEVVFRNGWDYMRGLLTGAEANEPKLPPPEVLRNILVDLGPVYIKLGQLLSTRPDLLPVEYIDALSTLQADVPPVAWSEVEIVIREQLQRPLAEVFATVNPQPVAAGSIAQTHKGLMADGREVALKIQRPGIDAIIAQDISLIKAIAELVSLSEFGQNYDVVALADDFAKALLAELDFTQEARYTDQLRKNLSKSTWFEPKQVVVPQIYWEATTERLLVMEWLDGLPLLSADFSQVVNGKSPSIRKQEITTLLCRVFFQQLYINGFFHADPHPGNLFYLQDGRLALIDCGMMGRLDPRSQRILTEMLLAIVDLDAERCTQLTLQLSESSQPINLVQLENDYARMLRKYYNLSLSQINFSQVFYELLQTARNNKIRLPGNLGLYAKTIANLEGVARTFNPEINLLDEIKPLMTDLFRRQLLGDDPIQALLRTGIDLKNLSLQSPRQVELLLNRITSETLQWNLNLRDMDLLRRSLGGSANRLSFSIVVGSLIIGAAIISTKAQTAQISWLSNTLFAVASFLGLWLVVSILRSGDFK